MEQHRAWLVLLVLVLVLVLLPPLLTLLNTGSWPNNIADVSGASNNPGNWWRVRRSASSSRVEMIVEAGRMSS